MTTSISIDQILATKLWFDDYITYASFYWMVEKQ